MMDIAVTPPGDRLFNQLEGGMEKDKKGREGD
jgi:hypothetical protein